MPDATPFAALKRYVASTVSPKSALVAVSRAIEARALSVRGPAEMWVCLQDNTFNVAPTRAVHDRLAARGVIIHLYGVGVRSSMPRPDGIILHDLPEDSPVTREWSVLLLSADRGLGMSAREMAPRSSAAGTVDLERRFEWLLCADQADVRLAAATLPGSGDGANS